MLPGETQNRDKATEANNQNAIKPTDRRFSQLPGPSTARSKPCNSNSESPTRSLFKRNSLHANILTSRNKFKLSDHRGFDSMSGYDFRGLRVHEVDSTSTDDNLSHVDGELKASRQVISLLQRELQVIRSEKEALERLITSQAGIQSNNQAAHEPGERNSSMDVANPPASSNLNRVAGNDVIDLIGNQTKDEQIMKLDLQLKYVQNEKEQLLIRHHLLEETNAKLQSEISVLNENISLRDQTIISLSLEVFDQNDVGQSCSTNRRQSSTDVLGGRANQSLHDAQRQIAKLLETIDAYRKTNELLNNNVIKLTEKCSQAEKRELEARSQCQELEAKCCQIQSKLLSLLKEIEQSSKHANESDDSKSQTQDLICSHSVKLLIKRLLEDKSLDIPLSWKEGNRPSGFRTNEGKTGSSKFECDELGFYLTNEDCSNSSSDQIDGQPKISGARLISQDEGEELDDLGSDSGTEFRRRTRMQQVSADGPRRDEAQWHMDWDNFIKDFDKVDLSKSKEFKHLLRSGVPHEYRCKVWKSLVDLRVGREREEYGQDYYQSLLEPNRPPKNPQSSLNSSSKQIELDLLRTLPNNRHFEHLDSAGTIRLRKVLTAYSEHNPKVGYCQGMNRLAAVALLILPEEEAFWCLVTIIDKIMPTGYYNDLWLAQVDSNVVIDFVAEKMPKLSDHFRRHAIELSLFAWFLTIFVDGTPPALFLRLWDSFLYEGDKILFRVALALLKLNETQLLEMNNSVSINNYLRSSINAPMDLDCFFELAFDWANPLSTRKLRSKRQDNFQQMKSGFDKPRGGTTASDLTSTRFDDRNHETKRNDESPEEDSSIISV